MEQREIDSAGIRVPPPVFFFIILVFGLLLEYFLPIKIIIFPRVLCAIFGGILIIISGYFALGAFIVLIKNKTTFDTAKSTTKIVTKGAFGISRNPLYFSLLLLLSGIAFILFSIWLFLMVPILYIVLLFKAIKPEERYLAQKFGVEYLEYSSKVRRWI